MSSENESDIYEDNDIEDVDIDGYEKVINGLDVVDESSLPGISDDTYKLMLANENITPEDRQKALSLPVQRKNSSIAGMNFTVANDASPRIQMNCSHNGQRLVFEGMTPRNIINGTEQEFGKSNFRIKVKENCIIREALRLYNSKLSKDTIDYNPRSYLIVQNTDIDKIGEFDLIVLEDYCSMHQHFGFRYKDGKDIYKVGKGNSLNKGDVLKETPSTTDNGDYMFGRELKTVAMTHRAVAEDGIAICSDVLEKFAFNMYESRRVSWGKKTFPLNKYGDENEYKICPDIGEYIGEDDILISIRETNDEVAIATQNKNSTRVIDYIFDESIYVVGGGRVISIDVTCNNEAENRFNDVERQLLKYHEQTTDFYRKIITLDKKLRNEFQGNYKPSQELNALVIEAYIGTNMNGSSKISKLYRHAQMDDFTVQFVVEKRVIPTFGFKFTDTRGRKSVCCAILPPEQMPVDKHGVRADIIVDPVSAINRMIMGAPIEHGINVITDIVVRNIKEALGINLSSAHLKKEIKMMAEASDPRFENAWNHATDYYRDIAPKSMLPKAKTATQQDKATVITHAVKHNLGLYLPPENAVNFAEALNHLHNKHNTKYESVVYKNSKGNLIRSKDPTAIADTYMMILEKIGDDRSACSSVRFQVFGVPATISKHERYTAPFRFQINKMGESEARPINCITRPSVHAELHDRNNNPKTAELCYRNIIRAQNPSQIEKLVDRSIVPFNYTMPMQILNHFTTCSGYEFVYKNDNKGLYTYQQMVEESK